jgi:hypothetical protein
MKKRRLCFRNPGSYRGCTKYLVYTLSPILLLFFLLPSAFASECASNWKTLHPEWIWCDDFETDKAAEYFESPAPLTRVSGVGLAGSYAMQATWTTGTSNAGSLKLAFGVTPAGSGINPPSGADHTTRFREIYYRVYLKSQSGWNSGTNNQSKFARLTSFAGPDWSQAMIAHLWSNDTSGNNDYLRSDPASCVTGGSVQCVGYNDFAHLVWIGALNGVTPIFAASSTGVWNCIEAHVKLNDPGMTNGVHEFWIDSRLEARSSNLNFTGTYTEYGVNALLLENYINNGAPQAQSRLMDNLVVSTQRIGCNTDAIVAPPQNLRVVSP